MLPDSVLIAATRRFQTRTAEISSRVAAGVAAAWLRLDSRDEADIATFEARTATIAAAGKAASVALATAFYSTIASARPPAISPGSVFVNLDVRAPFIAHWNALQHGQPWASAVESGRARAEAVGEQLVVSAGRRTGDVVAEAIADTTSERIVGWRRVLGAESCPWCELVATQQYKTAESADFGHDRCDCTAVPIIGRFDPGRVITSAA